jgi:hypothetical protein
MRKRKAGHDASIPDSPPRFKRGDFVLFQKMWPVKIIEVNKNRKYTVFSKADDAR